jgi:hypothetical protein
MNRLRKVTIVFSCLVGLIALITVLSLFSWFPKAVNVQSPEQVSPAAELDKTKVSPIFKSGSIYLQGEQGKIGILGRQGGYKAKEPSICVWHLWNQGDPFTGKKFRVEAVSIINGEKKPALLDRFALFEEINWPGGGPQNGADTVFSTMMRFDNPGLWRLDAFIDERAVGSITVEVK